MTIQKRKKIFGLFGVWMRLGPGSEVTSREFPVTGLNSPYVAVGRNEVTVSDPDTLTGIQVTELIRRKGHDIPDAVVQTIEKDVKFEGRQINFPENGFGPNIRWKPSRREGGS